MKVIFSTAHDGRATLVIAVGVIIYIGFLISGNPWWAIVLAGLFGSLLVFCCVSGLAHGLIY
jgi:hypothetical protein